MKIKRFDLLIIFFFCFVSAALFGAKLLAKTASAVAVIHYNQEEFRYDLNENQIFSIDSQDICLTIQIEKGSIRVEDAQCPDQTCQKTGWICRKGECIVCIPAGVMIEIEQKGESEYDALSG